MSESFVGISTASVRVRNRRDRNYELHDQNYATTVAGRQRRDMHDGWPVVYFRSEMVLHMSFHMQPVSSNTRQRQKWYLLSEIDRDAILENLETRDNA